VSDGGVRRPSLQADVAPEVRVRVRRVAVEACVLGHVRRRLVGLVAVVGHRALALRVLTPWSSDLKLGSLNLTTLLQNRANAHPPSSQNAVAGIVEARPLRN